MQVVILCGGLGTRMLSITSDKIPKCLIKINNAPFIDYQLQWLSSHGIKDVVLCISHLKEQIKDYVQDGSKWGISVKYVDDGETLLGTGGVLRKALEENKLETSFFIMYGDSFLPIDFKLVCDHWSDHYCSALMVVYKNNNKFDKSNADFNNGLVYYDKSNSNNYQYIDYGLSILHRNIIEQDIPSGVKYNLSDVFTKLSKNKLLAGYESKERFYEIGSIEGLKDFTDWINNEKDDYFRS